MDAATTLIATHSGLRGRPGAGLTPQIISDAVGSMVELLAERGQAPAVGVARDARPSGHLLLNHVVQAVIERGADVVDFGVVSTPTAKLAARQIGVGGVIVITGSHLSPDWNGLKLMAGPGFKPVDTGAMHPPGKVDAGRPRGAVSCDATAAGRHAAAVCAAVDASAIRAAGLEVRLVGGAGTAGRLALAGLGCLASGGPADLTMVMDADGDRLELVDEAGTTLDLEATLCLAALGTSSRTIVKGADTSAMIDVVMAESGGTVHVTRPGELHLLEALDATGADLAGEGNGGVVVPEVGMARDGLAAGALILDLMARTGAPLSSLAAGLPRFARRRFTVPCADASYARNALTALAERMGQPFEDSRHGVLVHRPDSTWGLVRQSATEPVLRVTVESREPAQVDALEADLRAGLARSG